jgi:hypothetical protein
MTRRIAALLAVTLALVLFGALPSQATEYRLRTAVDNLPVASESNAGYDRTKFKHWVDANKDCQNTRAEVLAAESRVRASGCAIKRGKWVSYYDRKTYTYASSLDIDHLVPLAEAWGSGARSWNAATRQSYANDLGDGRALVAVSATANRSKGARDAAQWLPRYDRCRYVREWTAVKLRWKLTVDRTEKAALKKVAAGCSNVVVKWSPARIVKAAPTSGTSVTEVKITRIVYNPAGSDTTANARYETVVVKNSSASRRYLTGWRLSDLAGNRYTLPPFSLSAGASVTIHSSKGSNTVTHLYAGWGHTWNNTGDTAYLRNSVGTLASKCTYSGGGSSVTC